jgi:putative cell wall-binding protein
MRSLRRLAVAVIGLSILALLPSTSAHAFHDIDLGAERLAGTDRILTSIAISQSLYADQGAGVVVLTRSDGFADALAGAPLAVGLGGPVLLNPTSHLNSSVAQEIQRVLDPGAALVILLGGEAALSPAVEDSLNGMGFDTLRIDGANRYETARNIAELITFLGGEPSTILLATGLSFADALSAGAVASNVGGVVLLSQDGAAAGPTNEFIAAHSAVPRYCFGGPACAAYPSSTHLVGQNRYETAVLAAEEFFEDAPIAGVANGQSPWDALSGAAHAGILGPLLLTERDFLPGPTADYLTIHRVAIEYAPVYGGEAVVSAPVFDEIDSRVTTP